MVASRLFSRKKLPQFEGCGFPRDSAPCILYNRRLFPVPPVMRPLRLQIWLYLLAPAALALCVCLGPTGFGLPDTATASGQVVLQLRLYRMAAGFLVGAGLACAGVVLQALLRNPLADPYVLGVSGGGALGAALVIFLGWHAVYALALPAGAFLLAIGTLVLVYTLASRAGALSTYGLILSGVVVSSMLSSFLMLLVFFAGDRMPPIIFWMLGNLQVTDTSLLLACGGCMLTAFLITWLLSRELNALTLGREMAYHLGVRTELTVALALGAATLAAASAVALCGLIGFVGLIIPHAMRQVAGANHSRLLPASAVAGGVFLVLCDTLARLVLAPVELPVGVITALTGGPFFLFLLRRRHRLGQP
jgi:iron complex transport system permease protein